MTPNKDLTRVSKKLAFILRHNPGSAGVQLDENGWAQTSDILKALSINMSILETIVVTDKKGRYAFDQYHKRIRAVQGHSININLGLAPTMPPDTLYHGTAKRNIGSIMSSGLQKMNRQYVHLSVDNDTAWTVGTRHGEAIVFQVDAHQMYIDGFLFYQAENGVWLTDNVPAKYLILTNM